MVVCLVTSKFSTECSGENILKIGQYLAKIWTKVCGLVFFAHLVYHVIIVDYETFLSGSVLCEMTLGKSVHVHS